jgi:antirestriction protein
MSSIGNLFYDLDKSMGSLSQYFDYEAFGRDLFMYDYTMGANGNVFRNL